MTTTMTTITTFRILIKFEIQYENGKTMIHYDMRCTTIIIYDNWKFQFNSHWIPLFILFVMMMMMRKIVIVVFFYFNCRKFLSLPVFSIDKNLSTLLPLSFEFHWESICFIYFLYHSLLMKEWVNLNRWKKV